ncbi:energy transducer TonB [uncultured Bacteroides sp.]|uniref:energy transducer TonB n=1 Tax=uncultured Bacteroides sp. TaxID=162156 RepID=UPI002AAC3254|nr:energy transducer TonB [uncultured Bacteroides sp.]
MRKYLLAIAFLSICITGARANISSLKLNEVKQVNDTTIDCFIEKMPEYKGGESAINEFIDKNLVYPKESHAEGKVYVRIVVSEKGRVREAEVFRSLDPYCDKEAIRVVKMLSNWTPAVMNGVNVPCYYIVVVRFKKG